MGHCLHADTGNDLIRYERDYENKKVFIYFYFRSISENTLS